MKRYNCVFSWISVTFARQHTIMMRSLSQLGTWRGPNNRALTCASLAESRHRGWWRAGDTQTFAKKIIIIYWLTLILSRHFRDLLVADEISDHQLGARSKFQLDHSVRGSVHHLLWIVTNNCHVTKNLTDLAALLNGCEAKVKTACSTENMSNITEVSCLSSSLQIRVDHGVARSPPA